LIVNHLLSKTRITEKEYLEAAKIHPRLKTRLNNFHRQMDLMDKSDDDCAAIRPEWITVDRIISSRYVAIFDNGQRLHGG
jgi:chromodomain-helicase-DNA-binding protein 4